MHNDGEKRADRDNDSARLDGDASMAPPPAGRLLTRSEVAKRTGVSVSTVRRLEGDALKPQIGPNGVRLFAEEQVRELTVRRRLEIHARPSDAFDGETAAAVFGLFDDGVHAVDVVKQLRIDPRAVSALWAQWARMRGGFVVDGDAAKRIAATSWMSGTFPIEDGATLAANLELSEPARCTHCSEAPTVCASCAVTMSAREAKAQAAMQQDAAEQRAHERRMTELDREMVARLRDRSRKPT